MTKAIKLKLAFLLGALSGGDFMQQHKNEIFLPAERLDLFSESATQVFAEITENDLLRY